MCINEKVSMTAFITCTTASIYLFYRNNKYDRWVSIAFFYIGFMQLLEYFMWIDQECKGLNQISTDLAFWHNIFQPVVSLVLAYIFTRGNISTYIYIPFILYLLYSVPKLFRNKKPNRCTKPCTNDSVGLSWEYTNINEKIPFVWLIFTLALAMPFLAMPNKGIFYFALIVGTYIISYFIAKSRCPINKNNIPTNGSWWCLMAAFGPLLAIYVNSK